MDNSVLSVIQIVNISLLLAWPALSLLALSQVKQRHELTGWLQIGWVFIIIAVPLLGAISFFMVAPKE